MNTRALLISTGIAGVLMALFSTLPFISVANCCLCLWLWTGGILAVFLYRRFAGIQGSITVSQGVLIGLLAGVISAILGAIFEAIFGPISWRIINNLINSVGGMEDSLGSITGLFGQAKGFSFVTLGLNLIIYSIFGLIGGLLGAVIFKGSKTAEQPAA